jgi:hypothetical protein
VAADLSIATPGEACSWHDLPFHRQVEIVEIDLDDLVGCEHPPPGMTALHR